MSIRTSPALILAVVIPAVIGVGLELVSRPEPDCDRPLRNLGQAVVLLALVATAAVLAVGGLLVVLVDWRRRLDPLRRGGPLVLAGISLPLALVISGMVAGSTCWAPDPGRAGEFTLALQAPSQTTLRGPVTCYGPVGAETLVRSDEGSISADPSSDLAVVFLSAAVSDDESMVVLGLARGLEFAEYQGSGDRPAPNSVRFSGLDPEPLTGEPLPTWVTPASGEFSWTC